MGSVRKLGLAMALAATLVAGGAVVQVRADSAAVATCRPAQTFACDILARTIQYLERLKPSPLRDALLVRARALQGQHCKTC